MLYRHNLNIASTLIFGCRPVSIIPFQVLHHGKPIKLIFFQRKSKLNFNHPSFVNISPTVVIIDTSMERSSLILQHRNLKICIFFEKGLNWILTCAEVIFSCIIQALSRIDVPWSDFVTMQRSGSRSITY